MLDGAAGVPSPATIRAAGGDMHRLATIIAAGLLVLGPGLGSAEISETLEGAAVGCLHRHDAAAALPQISQRDPSLQRLFSQSDRQGSRHDVGIGSCL